MPPPRQDAQIAQAIAQQPVYKPQQLLSQPGIVRDGTRLQKSSYIDGEWMRFWQDRPRKMLGYREQVRAVDGVARNINLYSNNGFCYVHVASTEAVQRYAIELSSGVPTTLIARTPGGYTPASNVLWQSDMIYDAVGTQTTMLFAVPLPSLDDITSETAAQVYYGDAVTTTALAAAINSGSGGGNITTSGGLVAVGPYLMLYGHDGVVSWNVPGAPLNRTDAGSGDSRPVSDKIVKGLPLRGQTAPAVVLWSLSALIVGNFVPDATPPWRFNTITTNGSILSANSVIEHNGVYYWAHTSGFSMFSGVMQDIPNEYNQQFFLDNLNFSQRQKVFAVKMPRWKEIWWCFPKGTATEPNHAVIFRYDKNYWYDTPLPNGGRAAGYYDVTYAYPIMTGVAVNDDTAGTSVWQHEFGLDEVSGPLATAKAIVSSFTTHEYNLPVAKPGDLGDNKALSYAWLEPDFDQVGDLTLEVLSRNNARSAVQSPETVANVYPYVIQETPASEQEQVLDLKWTGRLTAFKVTSNAVGGNYVAGASLLHMAPSDSRIIG